MTGKKKSRLGIEFGPAPCSFFNSVCLLFVGANVDIAHICLIQQVE